MKYGIDLDGVLADFNRGFTILMNQVAGTRVTNPKLDCWDWPNKYWPKADIDKAWVVIRGNPDWWRQLQPYEPSRFHPLQQASLQGHELYFLTQRPGPGVKEATESWLISNGIYRPTVLMTPDKGPVAAGLHLDALVDDRPENIHDVLNATLHTKCFIWDAPWNEEIYWPFVTRIRRMEEMFQ